MKYSFVFMLTLAAATLGSTSAALSQTTPAANSKIATIAFNAVVSQTNEFQRDFAVVQKKFAPKESELKSLGDEVDTLKKQLQSAGDKLPAEERETRTRAIDTKEKQLQLNTEAAQTDFQGESGQTFQKVAEKVFNFLQDYSKQNGYMAVIDHGNAQAPIIWYADPSIDISQAVVTAYNTKSGVPVQPNSSTPSAPRPNAARPGAPKAAPAKPTTPK